MNHELADRIGTVASERWLIGAQLLALMALGCGLLFLTDTTGGTVFLLSTLAPVLTIAACGIVLGVAISRFRRHHSLFHLETFAPGQIIFREGDVGDCAYFIQSGEVEVVRTLAGNEAVVAKLVAGQYFGEMALITNQPRSATIRTISLTKLALLGKRNFLTMLSAVPSARDDILRTFQERAMKDAAQ